MKTQFGVSWRTYLKNMAEIDDWISIKEYAKLYELQYYNVRDHFRKLYTWGFTARRTAKTEKYHFYEYKINPKGIDKVAYLFKSI